MLAIFFFLWQLRCPHFSALFFSWVHLALQASLHLPRRSWKVLSERWCLVQWVKSCAFCTNCLHLPCTVIQLFLKGVREGREETGGILGSKAFSIHLYSSQSHSGIEGMFKLMFTKNWPQWLVQECDILRGNEICYMLLPSCMSSWAALTVPRGSREQHSKAGINRGVWTSTPSLGGGQGYLWLFHRLEIWSGMNHV